MGPNLPLLLSCATAGKKKQSNGCGSKKRPRVPQLLVFGSISPGAALVYLFKPQPNASTHVTCVQLTFKVASDSAGTHWAGKDVSQAAASAFLEKLKTN